MIKLLKNLCKDDAGASLVEYGIMVALVAAVSIVAVTNIGTQVNTSFGQLVTALGG